MQNVPSTTGVVRKEESSEEGEGRPSITQELANFRSYSRTPSKWNGKDDAPMGIEIEGRGEEKERGTQV